MSDPSRRMPLPLRELALITLTMVLVSAVSFGMGYLAGRDRVAFVHSDDGARGIDADLADDALVELLARIDVSDAADKGLSELRYPDELRGRPQERSGPRFAIDLGAPPAERLDDLRTVLRGRGVHADVVSDGGDTRLVVGAFADPEEAASFLPLIVDALAGLGMGEPRVVADPRAPQAP